MEFKFRIYTRMLLMLVFMAPVSCAASDKFYADNVPPTGNPIEENTEYFEKFVDLGSATLEEKVDMAARLIPTPAQLEWQRWELTAFIHFTVNTWTGQEWGDGTENPDVFNPGELDTDQWVRTLKDAGFKLVMLTAKHHDGFCLWPTKTTSHSVASSSWKDGKGDVVQMLRESCDKYGMKLGLYVSPWDRNASCYGTPEYDDMFVAQITELLTWYGDVAEMWFDGANGSSIPGTPTHTFDWPRYMKAVKDLQPHVVTAIMGDDIRWVGNEAGRGREQEWSSVALQPAPLKNPATVVSGLEAKSADLGSRDVLSRAKALYWYPAEVDVSIRNGWFYHADQQPKSLETLKQIYFASVGSNAVLLLNIPPDTRGLLPDADVQRLGEFGTWIRESFTDNRVIGGDGAWQAASGKSREFDVQPGQLFNVVMLQEDIARGQRVERFRVEITSDGSTWETIAQGITIGHKRLVKLDTPRTARNLRVTIEQARRTANLSNVGLYYAK